MQVNKLINICNLNIIFKKKLFNCDKVMLSNKELDN